MSLRLRNVYTVSRLVIQYDALTTYEACVIDTLSSETIIGNVLLTGKGKECGLVISFKGICERNKDTTDID